MATAGVATTRSETAPHRAAIVPIATLALVVFAVLSMAPQIYNDGDTGWHIAAGRWILAAHGVPATDPFSFTFGGKPWLAHEWLAEIVMAGVYAAASWSAVSLLFAGAIAALVLILGLEIGRWLQPAPTLTVLMLVIIALLPFVLARPHVIAWPLLAGWTVILLRARDAGRQPPLVAALVMLVWANLHASFLLGFVLAGVFGLEALVAASDRRRVFLGWLGFGALSLLAALATPYGVHGLLFPLQVSGMPAISTVMEWRPTVLANDTGFKLVVLASLFALLYRGVRVPMFRLIILIGTLYLAFQAVRHQAILAIVGSLLLARPLALTFAPLPMAIAVPQRRSAMLLAAALALAVIVRMAIPVTRIDNGSNPISILAQVPAELRSQPVLNDYGFGGALVFAGIRPYIDGRVDMYGDAFTFDHGQIVAGNLPAFQRAVERWGLRWTILPPNSPLVAALDRLPGWRRLAADKWAVVHVRHMPPPSSPPV